MRVRFTAGARRQIANIYNYIAPDNLTAAREVVLRIEAVAELLRERPGMGRKIPGSQLRRFPVRPYPYLIYYVVRPSEIQIIRVQHAARRRAAFHEDAAAFAR